MSDHSEHRGFSLVLPFWIDTDAYSDRDREMFVSGYEFCQVVDMLQLGFNFSRPIHRENESRLRMAAAKLNRQVQITPHSGYDGCETWSEIKTQDDRE